MISAAMPVFATRWQTFKEGIVSHGVVEGKLWDTGDIRHCQDAVSIGYIYGTPWGNTLSCEYTLDWNIDLSKITGTAQAHTVDTYEEGTLEGTIRARFVGVGWYTYNGPTFSFVLGDRSGTFTSGTRYFGLIYEASAVKYGTSGALDGVLTRETATGLFFVLEGPYEGLGITESTVTYMDTGPP
jgi:hypothetical protein